MKRPQKKWMILGGALIAVLLIVFSVMSSRETGTEVEVGSQVNLFAGEEPSTTGPTGVT